MKRVNIAIITMPRGIISVRTDLPTRCWGSIPQKADTPDTPPMKLARDMLLVGHQTANDVRYGGTTVPLEHFARQLLRPEFSHVPDIQAMARTALGECAVAAAAARFTASTDAEREARFGEAMG